MIDGFHIPGQPDKYAMGLILQSSCPTLTHWDLSIRNGHNRASATFSKAFCRKKIFSFWLKFHLIVWFRWRLDAKHATRRYLNQGWVSSSTRYDVALSRPLKVEYHSPDSKVHGPVGPRWTPYWPHELCYLGQYDLYVHLRHFQKHFVERKYFHFD